MRRTIEMLGNPSDNMSKTGDKIKADSYYRYTDGIRPLV